MYRLGNSFLDTDVVKSLGDSLARNSSLTYLGLRKCGFNNVGKKILARAIEQRQAVSLQCDFSAW